MRGLLGAQPGPGRGLQGPARQCQTPAAALGRGKTKTMLFGGGKRDPCGFCGAGQRVGAFRVGVIYPCAARGAGPAGLSLPGAGPGAPGKFPLWGRPPPGLPGPAPAGTMTPPHTQRGAGRAGPGPGCWGRQGSGKNLTGSTAKRPFIFIFSPPPSSFSAPF